MAATIADSSSGKAPKDTGLGGEMSLSDFQRSIEPRIQAWLTEKERSWLDENSDLSELTSRLGEFVSRGGKRLRPALVFFAFRGLQGSNDDAIFDLAMSTELLHTYLLIHDDIMDHAEVRRGGPAAHLIFEGDHRSKRWRGDAGRHGESVAILLGDLAHSYAVELFLRSRSVFDQPALDSIFSAMCQEVVCGQYLEMTAPFRGGWEKDALLAVLRLKSGRYSVERPIELGATAAGASTETLSRLTGYGVALGEAFQLKDDLLGVFGASDTVGKSVDSDIAEGKFTVLIQQAFERSDKREVEVLASALGNRSVTAEVLERVREIVESSGARAEVEKMVESRLESAGRALAAVDLQSDAKAFFEQLIVFLRDRNH